MKIWIDLLQPEGREEKMHFNSLMMKNSLMREMKINSKGIRTLGSED
jgi:hypothetical protein